MHSLVVRRLKTLWHKRLWTLCLSVAVCCNQAENAAATDPSTTTATSTHANACPPITAAAKPCTYWYWMGGAIEESELTRHLELYQQAGLGGVHIVPIYGVRGVEQQYVPFLSPRWMELLAHTVDEANRLGLGVDMTTGTGWPFGGPDVQPSDAAKRFVLEEFTPNSQLQLDEAIVPQDKELTGPSLVVLMGYGPDGSSVDLTGKVDAAGRLDWHAPQPRWKATALFQAPTRLPVERAGAHRSID